MLPNDFLNIFNPHYNTFSLPSINGWNFYHALSLLLCSLIIFLIFIKKKNLILPLIILTLFFSLSLQTSAQWFDLNDRISLFKNKSWPQKQALLFPTIYPKTQEILSRLPQDKDYHCQLISPYNPNETLEPYLLAYYLLPKINLLHTKDPFNCQFIFNGNGYKIQ